MGEVIGSLILRLFAIPLTNVVLPAPRGPFKRRMPRWGNFFVSVDPNAIVDSGLSRVQQKLLLCWANELKTLNCSSESFFTISNRGILIHVCSY